MNAIISRYKAFVAVTGYSVLLAIFVTLQQIILKGGIHPLYVNAILYISAAVLLGGYALIWDRSIFRMTSKKGIALGIISAIFEAVLADMLVLYGLQKGSAITWSILTGAIPLVTYVITVIALRELFVPRKLIAILLSIIGATLVIYLPGTGLDLAHGAPFFLAAVVVFGVGNIFTGFAVRYLSGKQLTLIRLVTASVFMCLLLALFHPPFVAVNINLIIVNSIVLIFGVQLINYIMKIAGPTFFSLGSNMTPLFVAIFSIYFIHQWPTFMQFIGGAIIIGSVFLFQYAKNHTTSA